MTNSQPNEKFIIWSDEYDTIEAIAEDRKTDENSDFTDDNDAFAEAYFIDYKYLEDEKVNLNKELNQPIVAAITAHLWNGVHFGISDTLGTNLHDIFNVMAHSNCDYHSFFVENGDVFCEGLHHDGRNRYLLRKVKPGIDDLDDIFDRELNPGESLYDVFLQNTESLVPDLKKIYE